MPKLLRVGTDCSGIEAPIQALIQLKIPFEHVFSSEIDKYCIQSIKANYKPKIIFGDKDGLFPEGDITKRDINDVPDIDLYVCGFPCQPFSQAGERKGFKDKRGNVFWSCLEVIEKKQPKYFILENVRGLLSHDNKKTWKVIWEELQNLEKYGYEVDWKLLNTKDYGIPHSRERVYIVGFQKSNTNIFKWPKYKNMKSLTKYIEKSNIINKLPPRIEKSNYMSKIPDKSIYVDFSFYGRTFFPQSDKVCSCLTRKSAHWCVPKHRYATCKELLQLQGFSTKFTQVVSNTQLKKQIGNSISVNVLKEIYKKLL